MSIPSTPGNSSPHTEFALEDVTAAGALWHLVRAGDETEFHRLLGRLAAQMRVLSTIVELAILTEAEVGVPANVALELYVSAVLRDVAAEHYTGALGVPFHGARVHTELIRALQSRQKAEL